MTCTPGWASRLDVIQGTWQDSESETDSLTVSEYSSGLLLMSLDFDGDEHVKDGTYLGSVATVIEIQIEVTPITGQSSKQLKLSWATPTGQVEHTLTSTSSSDWGVPIVAADFNETWELETDRELVITEATPIGAWLEFADLPGLADGTYVGLFDGTLDVGNPGSPSLSITIRIQAECADPKKCLQVYAPKVTFVGVPTMSDRYEEED